LSPGRTRYRRKLRGRMRTASRVYVLLREEEGRMSGGKIWTGCARKGKGKIRLMEQEGEGPGTSAAGGKQKGIPGGRQHGLARRRRKETESTAGGQKGEKVDSIAHLENRRGKRKEMKGISCQRICEIEPNCSGPSKPAQ